MEPPGAVGRQDALSGAASLAFVVALSSGYADGIAQMESGGRANPGDNPFWPAAMGGPAGPHQFISSTWQTFVRDNPAPFAGMTPTQVLAARTDPNLSRQATLWYARYNAPTLQRAGIIATPANLAIAHALGAEGATRVLAAPDATPLAALIPETLRQNPPYQHMSVGDLRQKYAGLEGTLVNEVSASPPSPCADVPSYDLWARTACEDAHKEDKW